MVEIKEEASKLGLVLFDGEAAMTGGNELRGGDFKWWGEWLLVCGPN